MLGSNIGVIIPVYNGEKYLSSLFESLESQSEKGFRVYVLLDGSKDKSLEIVKSFAHNHKNVEIIISEENCGISKSIKYLVKAAEKDCDYCLLLAQDDQIPSNFIECVLKLLEKKPNVMVAPLMLHIDYEGKRMAGVTAPIYFKILGKMMPSLLMNSNFLVSPGMVFPSKTFPGFEISDEAYLTHDWQQWLSSSLNHEIVIMNSTRIMYRVHSENVSHQRTYLKIHKEMQIFYDSFLTSDKFREYLGTLSQLKRVLFFIIYKLSRLEFSNCRHHLQWERKLKELIFNVDEERKVIRYSPCGELNSSSPKTRFNLYARSKFRLRTLSKSSHGRVIGTFLVIESTIKFIGTRVILAFGATFTRIRKSIRLKRIYCVAGLGGQLNALAYSIWLKKNLNIDTTIRFTQNHVGLTENRLDDILDFFEHSQVLSKKNIEGDTVNIAIREPTESQLMGLKQYIASLLIKSRFIVRSDHLSKRALSTIRPWTKFIQGYHSDTAILLESIPELSNIISQTSKPNFLFGAGSVNSISIHWRLGDYLSNPIHNHTHGVISAEQIISCVQSLPVEMRDYPIFLYSDSIEIAKSIFASADFFQRMTFLCGDIWQDLYAMTRSKIFIGSHSSISVWVSLSILNSNNNATVYLPANWFKNIPSGFIDPKNPFELPHVTLPQIRKY